MEIVIDVVLLLVGFVMLIKGADYFVDGASGIADKLKIPQIVIGLTIVAFGTSAPEAAISISAALKGSADISIGNIIGSNIMNILLILGIASCITPLAVENTTVKYEIPFVIFITVLLVVLGALFGKLNFICGIILWAIFIGFFVYLIRISKKKRPQAEAPKQATKLPVLIFFTVLGLAAIVVGSQVTVNSASSIARALGVSERIIGLTIVAFGTSLPELMTSVSAARKGKNEIAVGNIVGSNIFNILFILGTTSLITAVPYGTEFIFDGIVAVIAAALLFVGVAGRKKLGRAMGASMLAVYAAYFIYLLVKA